MKEPLVLWFEPLSILLVLDFNFVSSVFFVVKRLRFTMVFYHNNHRRSRLCRELPGS